MGNHVGIIGIPQKIALPQGAKSGILFSNKPRMMYGEKIGLS
jgi:hypothetical protein